MIISDKFIFSFASMVFEAQFLHNYNWQCFSGGYIVDLIFVISSGFGPLSLSKFEKKVSQYTLKLCHIINNISMRVYITIWGCVSETPGITLARQNCHFSTVKPFLLYWIRDGFRSRAHSKRTVGCYLIVRWYSQNDL